MLGLAAVADTFTGNQLGLRGMFPEPLDVFNHGMSMAAGAMLASHSYTRSMRDEAPTYRAALDISLSNPDRYQSVGRLRRAIKGAAIGAFFAGSFYVVAGEVGSEAIHYVYDKQHQNVAPANRKPLRVGHFDILDLTYGLGAAAAVVKLSQRNSTRTVDSIAATLPPLKARKPARPIPKQNGRYTPPRKRN